MTPKVSNVPPCQTSHLPFSSNHHLHVGNPVDFSTADRVLVTIFVADTSLQLVQSTDLYCTVSEAGVASRPLGNTPHAPRAMN